MDNHRWNDNHGPDELYDKFEVRDKRGKLLGEDGGFIFPLRPERDREAHRALRWYAHYVESRSPNLARQIRERLDSIEEDQLKST